LRERFFWEQEAVKFFFTNGQLAIIIWSNAIHKKGGVIVHVQSIGIKAKNIDDMIQKVKTGLPVKSFEKLGKKLGVSDNLLSQRIARLYDKALDVFEDEKSAEKWLKEPARGLGGDIPLEYAKTELGAREVERLLSRIEHGVFPG
jgi:uncharacterized protein (DUF2384 family)